MHHGSSSSSRNRSRALRALQAGNFFEVLESRQLLSSSTGSDVAQAASQIDGPVINPLVTAPIIGVTGGTGNTAIASGDITPQRDDFTDFGYMAVNSLNGNSTRQFFIKNTGNADLTLTGGNSLVTISGANASDFTVTANPTATLVTNGSTTFTITFNPSAEGTRNATVTIASNDPATPSYTFAISGKGVTTTDQSNNLQVVTTQTGNGLAAINGDPLTVNYTGYLLNGTVFDSSLTTGHVPFNFTIGTGQVISGWDQGLLGIKPGESRVLVIPSALGYGTAGSGSSIPPNSVLIFEVTRLVPTISVAGKSVTIPNGDTTASTTDDTDLGSLVAGSLFANTHTFTVTRTNSVFMTANPGITVSGTNPGDFSVTQLSGSATFKVNFKPLAGSSGVRTATISIYANDPNATPYTFTVQGTVIPGVWIDSVTQNEGNSGQTSFNFTVHLDGTNTNGVTVHYATAAGYPNPAVAGTDYTAVPDTVLTWAAGDQASKTVTVLVNGNTTSESDKTFFINLSSPTGAALETSQGVGTIVNDDVGPLTISDTTVAEGDGTPKNFAEFIVTLPGAALSTVTVKYATANGTTPSNHATQGAIAGVDYIATSGTLTFAPGETSKHILVPIIGNTKQQLDKTFTITLSDATNDTIGRATATGTITNDDLPTVTVTTSGSPSEKLDGAKGKNTITFTRSYATASDLIVNLTIGGTATAGVDYTALPGTVTIPAGKTSVTIPFTTIADNIAEGTQTVQITVASDPTYKTDSVKSTKTLSIIDSAPTVSITKTKDASEKNPVTTGKGTFTVTLDHVMTTDTVVNYTVTGSAVSGTDFTALPGSVTIPAGKLSQTISLTPIDDAATEGAETVVLTLVQDATPTYNLATALKKTATLTIVDYELAPEIVAGRTLAATIKSGSGVFATTGTFKLIFSSTGNQYMIVGGSTAVGNSLGTYTYQRISSTVGQLVLTDTTTGAYNELITFTTGTAATFSVTKGADTQTGSMTLQAAPKALAPNNVNGRTASVTLTAGSGVLAKKGSIKIAFASVTDSYTITAVPPLASSTGTFTYQLFAPNVALINYVDSQTQNGWASLIFTSASSVSYVYTATTLSGTQRGTATVK